VEAHIGGIMRVCLRHYQQSLGVAQFWPANPLSEAIRLKRYLPNGHDGFPPHVDVMDHSTSYRLATAIYT
jgi:hypothetical protein